MRGCRARLRGEIRDLQGRLGITTIMVTHDQEEALTMSDRIVVMNAGRIEQVGAPGEIYGRPATPFVADFVGRMNFLEGRILDDTRIDVRGATLMIAEPIRFGPGTPVTVCLRPEDVVVNGSAEHQANRLDMQIGVMEFVGSHFSTVLHAAGTNLNVTADLSINDVRSLGLMAGKSIPVQLPPDRLKVFVHPPQA